MLKVSGFAAIGALAGRGLYACIGMVRMPGQEAEPPKALMNTNDNEVMLVFTEVPFAENVNDDMSFAEAFKTAREEVQSGGFFEWQGNTYGTYYENEWEALSNEEKENFWDAVSTQSAHQEARTYTEEEFNQLTEEELTAMADDARIPDDGAPDEVPDNVISEDEISDEELMEEEEIDEETVDFNEKDINDEEEEVLEDDELEEEEVAFDDQEVEKEVDGIVLPDIPVDEVQDDFIDDGDISELHNL